MQVADTIPARLFEHAQIRPNDIGYYTRNENDWDAVTWQTFADQVQQAGQAMLGLGVERGRCLAILGNNRPEWSIFSLASMSIGSASAGLYTNTPTNELVDILQHAECPLVLIQDHKQWKEINDQRDKLPLLRQIILMKDTEPVDDPLTLSWEEFLACGESVAIDDFHKRLQKIVPEQIATFTYTYSQESGPKGVMLSHENLLWTSAILADMLNAGPGDWGFSSLPMAHMSEQLFTLHLPIVAGFGVYYSRSIQTLLEDLIYAQPSIFFSVPQVWEQIVKVIKEQIKQLPSSQTKRTEWAMAKGAEHTSKVFSGESTSFWLNLQMSLARPLVLDNLKRSIGLERARFCACGLSSLSEETLTFLASLELPVYEAFGDDETTGLALLNLPGATQKGSVGQPLPEVEYQFDEDGYLQLKGPNIFLGYFKDNRTTSENLSFGWYTTTVKGHSDETGFLFITRDDTES